MSVRWGFLGAGWIASRALAPAVHDSANAVLRTVAARDSDRAHRLEPVRVHASYGDVIDDPAVDIVYVALSNGQHEEWSLRALAAGKHVLCEKPLAADPQSAARMADAAAEAGRLLVEAVWCRWHPRWRRLEEMARAGELGVLVSVDSAFTFPAALAGNYRADPARGGGALLDVGGYQAHGWLAVAGAAVRIDVDEVVADRGETGVDLTTRARVRLGASARGTLVASFTMPEHQYLTVTGSQAIARMDLGPAFTAWREPTSLRVGSHVEHFAPVDAYRLMVEAVSDRVLGHEAWIVPTADTLAAAAALEAIRRAGVA